MTDLTPKTGISLHIWWRAYYQTMRLRFFIYVKPENHNFGSKLNIMVPLMIPQFRYGISQLYTYVDTFKRCVTPSAHCSFEKASIQNPSCNECPTARYRYLCMCNFHHRSILIASVWINPTHTMQLGVPTSICWAKRNNGFRIVNNSPSLNGPAFSVN